MWYDITAKQRRSSCTGCGKPFKGSYSEFVFRISKNGCGINFCSNCLRGYADELDAKNQDPVEAEKIQKLLLKPQNVTTN